MKKKEKAFFEAVANADTDLIKRSLEKSPELIHAINENGLTPLTFAVFEQKKTVVNQLLELAPDTSYIDSLDKHGLAALHWAVCKEDMHMLRILLRWGANPNRFSKSGMAPLHFAADSNLIEGARLLVDAGAKLDIGTNSAINGETTPRMIAIVHRKAEMVRFLDAAQERQQLMVTPEDSVAVDEREPDLDL